MRNCEKQKGNNTEKRLEKTAAEKEKSRKS
jgi:hypothetical protein